MKKDLFNLIKITIIAIFFSVGVGYLSAWMPGSTTPPSSNTNTPINVKFSDKQAIGGSNTDGSVLQIYGNLLSDSFTSFGPATFAGDFLVEGMTETGMTSLCSIANSSGVYDGTIGFCPSPPIPVAPPVADISTNVPTDISANSVTSGGSVTSDGGATIFERGVVWGTAPNPTVNKVTSGAGTGSFTVSITGLTANTLYYVRAYAINSVGTSYSASTRTFTTLGLSNLLQVTKSGTGEGVVSGPSSISCGTNCQAFFTPGTYVTLGTTATPPSYFMGWSGACTNTTGGCTVLMDSIKTVNANFSTCNGSMISGYCWYKGAINQNCSSYCINRGTCVNPNISYNTEVQVCSALGMGSVQMSAGSNIAPRTDQNSTYCYVQGNSSTPTALLLKSTCSSVYNQWQANACACTQ